MIHLRISYTSIRFLSIVSIFSLFWLQMQYHSYYYVPFECSLYRFFSFFLHKCVCEVCTYRFLHACNTTHTHNNFVCECIATTNCPGLFFLSTILIADSCINFNSHTRFSASSNNLMQL